MTKRPFIAGLIAADTLLALFIVLVTSISGWATTKSQFSHYWYFLVPLAVGFGVQVGLYVYLREVVKRMMSKKMMAVTGSTSTAAMISCCTHYLVNILPIISAAGVASFIGQYQVKLFWVGIAFNLFGIASIGRQVVRARRHMVDKSVLPATAPPPEKSLINNAVVVVAFVIIVGAVWLFSGRASQTANTVTAAGTAGASNASLTKTNAENGMTVAVTPKKNDDGSWDFSVAIDNHAVSVTQDMVAVSTLTDAAGRHWPPQSWTGDPPGGHHRKGILKFNSLSSPPASLTIRDLGGVLERTFTWDGLST